MPGRPPQVAWRCSRNELSGKTGAVHPEEPPRSEGVYHLYVVLIEDRDRVRRELERAGISTGLH